MQGLLPFLTGSQIDSDIMSTGIRKVEICDYRQDWALEFQQIADAIRKAVGKAVQRIDHIGSTAVPGLAAKDVIDVQITVKSLDEVTGVVGPLRAVGYRQGLEYVYDEFRGRPNDDRELRKRYMREPAGHRRIHIHIREQDRFNQQYALLFRDYLRASATMRVEYECFKRRAAAVFPTDIDGYLALKYPVFHLLFEAARQWAEQVDWRPDERHS